MRLLAITLALAASPSGAQTIWRVAMFGDSIINPNFAAPYVKLPVASHYAAGIWYVMDQYGVPGDAVASVQSRWVSDVKNWPNPRPTAKAYTHLTVLVGVNNLNAGQTSAAIISALTALYDDIRTSGLGIRLMPVTLTPYGASGTWTPERQIALEAVNAFELEYCITHSLTCIDAYAALKDPDNPTALLAAYDSGDGGHLSQAGTNALAALEAAAVRATP